MVFRKYKLFFLLSFVLPLALTAAAAAEVEVSYGPTPIPTGDATSQNDITSETIAS